jgi:hypothetical protein
MATVSAARTPGAPPAVLAAFLRQGRYKTWALFAQFGLNLLLVLCLWGALHREPDVVLVSPDGQSTYVNRSLAGEALVRFLSEQRQLPSDVTILHFSKVFLDLVLAVNSSTIEGTWPQALALMDPELRARVQRQAAEQKLIQGYQLAQTKTSLHYEEAHLLEHTDALVHLHATLRRTRSSLLAREGSGELLDRVGVDLVERIVPRTPAHPDGLVVSDWRVEVLPREPKVANDVPTVGAEK